MYSICYQAMTKGRKFVICIEFLQRRVTMARGDFKSCALTAAEEAPANDVPGILQGQGIKLIATQCRQCRMGGVALTNQWLRTFN